VEPLIGGSDDDGGGGEASTKADGEAEMVERWEEEVALAVPQLRWINGRSITRLTDAKVVLGSESGPGAEGIDKMLLCMWPHVEPMRLAASEEHHAEVYWYAMDLPGQGIGPAFPPSLGPHLAFVPMRDRHLGVTFSVAWPVRTIKAGEVVCRDVLADFPLSSPSSVSGDDVVSVRKKEEDELREQVLCALWGQRLW